MRGGLKRAAVAAAVLAGAAGPPARAQTTTADAILASFRALCLSTGADRAAALAAADKLGWFPVPDAAMAVSAPRFQNPVGRLRSAGGEFQFLVVGEQTRQLGGRAVRMHACGVGGSTPQTARLDAGMQELAGAPRSARLSDAEQTVWTYADESGRRTPLDDGDAKRTAAALDGGALRLLSRQTRVSPGMPTGLAVLTLDVPAR